MRNHVIKEISLNALVLALILICTIYFIIPTSFGYLNVSDAIILLSVLILKNKYSCLVLAFGCCMSDLYLGFGQYALFTLIIKFLEAFTCRKMLNMNINYYIVYFIGLMIMLIGYGLTDVILSSNVTYFSVSLLANLPQAIVCYIIAILLFKPVNKLNLK